MFSTSNENGAVAIDAPISGLDHVIIAVHDLDAEHARAVKLGFTTTEITPHVGWGTANTCIMFPGLDDQGDYVEILGIRDPNIGTNGLAEHLEALGEGMLSLALKGSAEKAADAFAAHSVEHFGIPQEAERQSWCYYPFQTKCHFGPPALLRAGTPSGSTTTATKARIIFRKKFQK